MAADPYGGSKYTYGSPSTTTIGDSGGWDNTPGASFLSRTRGSGGDYTVPAGGGQRGGGGGGSSIVQSPSGNLWNPMDGGGWIASPDFMLSQQKQGFDQQRFQQVWGGLNGMLGQLNGGYATPGGQSGFGPPIGAQGVLTPEQIEQQVNAARASNDQGTASRTRDFTARASGQGFGANSPLVMAMNQSFQNANMATNADSERGIRLGAAEKNAGQLLEGQKAQEAQFASRQDEDIRRRQPYFSTMNALIGALAGLAG